jgi:Ser/Thr protein kinase RdoA (MazF antagonist)
MNSSGAVAAARNILERHGLAIEGAETLHESNNVVLLLRTAGIVVKVARSDANKDELELTTATHLLAAGVPCIRPAKNMPAHAHIADGYGVTFWEYFDGASTESPDRNRSLELIRRLHDGLNSLRGMRLPEFADTLNDCIGSLEREVEPMQGLANEDRELMARTLGKLKVELNEADTDWGIIHGDCRPQNLLWDRAGNAAWADFEAVCRGPILWDYVSFFGPEDDILRPHAKILGTLKAITHACVATWCWRKTNRSAKDQEAAEYHLEELKCLLRFEARRQ